MTLAIYIAGAWLTTAIAFACELHQDRDDSKNSLLMDLALIVIVSAFWPALWLVFAGLRIRTAMLKARERAIVEGKKRFGA